MGAAVLDGEALATIIKADLRGRIDALRATGRPPGLATLLVGDDEPSARYVAMKHRDCADLGIASVYEDHLPATATQEEVLAVVDRFNTDPAVDAMLLQHPFPSHLDYESALLTADPDKDVDGLHPVNLGRLVMGVDGPLPCTPHGIQRLLSHYGVPIRLPGSWWGLAALGPEPTMAKFTRARWCSGCGARRGRRSCRSTPSTAPSTSACAPVVPPRWLASCSPPAAGPSGGAPGPTSSTSPWPTPSPTRPGRWARRSPWTRPPS